MLNYKTLLFDIVTTIDFAIWPAMNKNLQSVLVKIYTSGGGPQFTARTTASQQRKCCPRSPSFIGSDRWKKEGAKTELHCGCGTTVQPRLAVCSMNYNLVWDLALSFCKWKDVFFSVLTREIRAFSLVSVAMQRSELMVCRIQGNPEGSHFSYPKRQCTSLQALRAAYGTFSAKRIHMSPLHGLPF